MSDPKFHTFQSNTQNIALPSRFTFPFYYTPSKIALKAVEELQKYLSTTNDIGHNFGINDSTSGLGKMFGVLVVKNSKNQIGYLIAYSGSLSGSNSLNRFVPPVFNFMEKGGYFLKESVKINSLNDKIIELEKKPEIHSSRLALDRQTKISNQKIKEQKKQIKEWQVIRRQSREEVKDKISQSDFQSLLKQHNQESINDTFLYKEYSEYLKQKIAPYKAEFDRLQNEITFLKEEMKSKSIALQKWLFAKYEFLNTAGNKRSALNIFKERIKDIPPSGTGDCAAPKLLQYAFINGLTPISMAEFWWGKAPNSETKRHKYYYPACRGKCEPILAHMLEGLECDPNPLLENPIYNQELPVIFEDEHLLVINKPPEFMSVPGIHVTDSVQERMKAKYPNATGPMIVHRLDMSTSGLLIIAKTKESHKHLQEQFRSRKIKKRYVALLDGIVDKKEGFINLPLRVDLENRPFQIICYEHGKSARTQYEVIEEKNGQTRIHFYPITGRTHQLRVHASHHKGLNAPIIGDDLYGRKGDRLHLHAEKIEFTHPISRDLISLQCDPDF